MNKYLFILSLTVAIMLSPPVAAVELPISPEKMAYLETLTEKQQEKIKADESAKRVEYENEIRAAILSDARKGIGLSYQSIQLLRNFKYFENNAMFKLYQIETWGQLWTVEKILQKNGYPVFAAQNSLLEANGIDWTSNVYFGTNGITENPHDSNLSQACGLLNRISRFLDTRLLKVDPNLPIPEALKSKYNEENKIICAKNSDFYLNNPLPNNFDIGKFSEYPDQTQELITIINHATDIEKLVQTVGTENFSCKPDQKDSPGKSYHDYLPELQRSIECYNIELNLEEFDFDLKNWSWLSNEGPAPGKSNNDLNQLSGKFHEGDVFKLKYASGLNLNVQFSSTGSCNKVDFFESTFKTHIRRLIKYTADDYSEKDKPLVPTITSKTAYVKSSQCQAKVSLEFSGFDEDLKKIINSDEIESILKKDAIQLAKEKFNN